MSEEHTPYFSVRTRIGDVTSPKDLVGLKDFTIEVTMGNTDAIKIYSKEDLAKIEQQKNIFDVVEEVYKQRDEWAKQRGYQFVDQIKRDEP